MATKEDLIKIIDQVATKFELSKLQKLNTIVQDLQPLDELLAHNAQTARDQLQDKAESLLGALPDAQKAALLSLFTRVSAEDLKIAAHMLEYKFPAEQLIFFHINDALLKEHEIPQINPGASQAFSSFLSANPKAHVTILSHESADVTSMLTAALVGTAPIASGQVSMIYESGLGLYLGVGNKEKKDYTVGMRLELVHVLERMAIAAATRISEPEFRDRFYYCSTEYSAGIRVHPYARSLTNNLDKEAAVELVKGLATALADLVKEDVAAIERYAMNYFLAKDPKLGVLFSKTTDERVWDVEKVHQYLDMIEFIHLGTRGSIIRPADATDVLAAETIMHTLKSDVTVVSIGNSRFVLPLLQWTNKQQHSLISCGEDADVEVKSMVESQGGIEYRPGDVSEVLHILDAYATIRGLLKSI